MAYFHVTASGDALLWKGPAKKVRVTINSALTGTITVADSATAQSSTGVVGIITNPAVGNLYEYWDLQNGVDINPSATCEITVNITSSAR